MSNTENQISRWFGMLSASETKDYAIAKLIAKQAAISEETERLRRENAELRKTLTEERKEKDKYLNLYYELLQNDDRDKVRRVIRDAQQLNDSAKYLCEAVRTMPNWDEEPDEAWEHFDTVVDARIAVERDMHQFNKRMNAATELLEGVDDK